MKTLVEKLEKEIPHGHWCNNGGRDQWCKYFEIKKPSLSENGAIQSYYCHFQEEFVNRKTCEINE